MRGLVTLAARLRRWAPSWQGWAGWPGAARARTPRSSESYTADQCHQHCMSPKHKLDLACVMVRPPDSQKTLSPINLVVSACIGACLLRP